MSVWDKLHLYWIYLTLAIQLITLRIILHIPVLGSKVANVVHVATNVHLTDMQAWDWIWTMCTYKGWESMCQNETCNYFKKVKLHSDAPNTTLHTLDGHECQLLDYMRPGRPLVLNFGSCT